MRSPSWLSSLTLRRAVAYGLALLMASCVSLPTSQTAAFKTIAASTQTSFAGLSDTETSELQADQFELIASRQKHLLQSPSCFAAEASTEPCVLIAANIGSNDPSAGISLQSHTAHVEKLIAAISSYASSMSDLAAAKDLASASTAASAVATSLKTLVKSMDPAVSAVVGRAIDALQFTNDQLQRERRREFLLSLATKAQPVIDGAAQALSEEATQLRGTLYAVRMNKYQALITQLQTDEETRQLSEADRVSLLQNIAQAASNVSSARAIQTDFSPLSKAHQAVLNALKDPKIDVSESVAQAQAFLGVLQSLAAAKAAPPPKKAVAAH